MDYKDLPEEFQKHIKVLNSGCWEWTGTEEGRKEYMEFVAEYLIARDAGKDGKHIGH